MRNIEIKNVLFESGNLLNNNKTSIAPKSSRTRAQRQQTSIVKYDVMNRHPQKL